MIPPHGFEHLPLSINLGMGAEILYSFVIIFCSLMIYFGTKELYELSSYKGLKYFRLAFLFLAISYIFRVPLILRLPIESTISLIDLYISLFAFMYFSSMAIFYLIESVLWKKVNKSKNINSMTYIFHAIAIVISLATIAFDKPLFYLGLNVILFISAGVFIYTSSEGDKKKKENNKKSFQKLYLLFLVFLILNIFNILVPVFLQAIKLFLYLVSLSVFFVILYRVLKKSGN